MARKRKAAATAHRGKFSEALEGILSQISAGFVKELKIEPATARKAAEIAVEIIRETTGGGTLYVAKGHLYAITERHRLIYRRFNGHNHFELAREFDLSERQIYSIIERVSAEEFDRKQPGLPGLSCGQG